MSSPIHWGIKYLYKTHFSDFTAYTVNTSKSKPVKEPAQCTIGKREFLFLTISVVIRGSVAAEPFVMRGEKDGGVLVADEVLQ